MSTEAAERKEIAAGAGLASLGVLITGVVGVVIMAILTRLASDTGAFTRNDLSLFSKIFLVQDTVSALLPLGLPAALTYFLPRRPAGEGRALGFWVGVTLFLLAIPVAVVLPLVAPMLSTEPHLVMGYRFLAFYLLMDLPGQALSGYYLAGFRYREYFGVTVVFAVSRLASLVIPAALGASFPTLLAAFTAVAGLRLVWFLGVFLLKEHGTLSPSVVRPRELLSYGLPLSLALIVGKLNVQADNYLILIVASNAVYLAYSLGAIEIPLVSTLAYTVTNALTPALSTAAHRKDHAAFVRLWHGAMLKVAVVMMPVFFFLFVLAGPTMRVLFTRDFALAAVPFRIYLLLLPLRLCGYGQVARSLGETKVVLTSSIGAAAVNAALMYPLYLAFGVGGPPFATVLGQLAAIYILLGRIRLGVELSWKAIMPTAALLRIFLVAGLAAIPVGLLTLSGLSDGLQLLIGGGLMLPLYLWLGRRAGFLSAEDRRYVVHLLTLRSLKRSPAGGATP